MLDSEDFLTLLIALSCLVKKRRKEKKIKPKVSFLPWLYLALVAVSTVVFGSMNCSFMQVEIAVELQIVILVSSHS